MCIDRFIIVDFSVIDREAISFLQEKLPQIFGIEVRKVVPAALQPQWYDDKRGQYRAAMLLHALIPFAMPNSIVLGVTDKDIFEDGLNFVFGIASPVAHVALIATARLSNGFYGLMEDRNLFLRRVLTEADHEIGHAFGLGHCPNPHCVMHFSNTLADTDAKGYRFCERCWSQIAPKLCRG